MSRQISHNVNVYALSEEAKHAFLEAVNTQASVLGYQWDGYNCFYESQSYTADYNEFEFYNIINGLDRSSINFVNVSTEKNEIVWN